MANIPGNHGMTMVCLFDDSQIYVSKGRREKGCQIRGKALDDISLTKWQSHTHENLELVLWIVLIVRE